MATVALDDGVGEHRDDDLEGNREALSLDARLPVADVGEEFVDAHLDGIARNPVS